MLQCATNNQEQSKITRKNVGCQSKAARNYEAKQSSKELSVRSVSNLVM